MPLQTAELRDTYESLLRTGFRGVPSVPRQVFGWHFRQSQMCEDALAPAAALRHLDWLVAAEPGLKALAVRRAVQTELGH